MLGGIVPDALVTGFLDTLQKSGPVGAILAAIVVVLTLSVIIFARTKGLWDDTKSRDQGIAFQDRLLKMIDTLQASEQAMRARVDAMAQESVAREEEIGELRAGLALLRSQRRRLIELMRAGAPRRQSA